MYISAAEMCISAAKIQFFFGINKLSDGEVTFFSYTEGCLLLLFIRLNPMPCGWKVKAPVRLDVCFLKEFLFGD